MQLEARPWQILGDVGGAGPVLGGVWADSRRAQRGRGAQRAERAQRVPARRTQRRLEAPRAPRASRLHCRQRTHLYRLTLTKIKILKIVYTSNILTYKNHVKTTNAMTGQREYNHYVR